MKISIVMANFNGAAHLDEAIASVLRQTHADLELLVADDASPDDSVAIVRRWMLRDPRVRLIECPVNAGAAATRNRALDAASGDWIAIMDSDDVMHPQRLERLLAAAKAYGAGMVADDMLFFSETPDGAGRSLLQALALVAPRWLSTAELVASDVPGQGLPPFGYLKFMIRRDALGALRYCEDLKVAEDFDFYVRLLETGLQALIVPEPMYLYRRHSASLSYRLSSDVISRMLKAQDAVQYETEPELALIFSHRKRYLRRQLAFQHLVEALKQRKFALASWHVLRRPGLLRDLTQSLKEGRARAMAPSGPEKEPRRIVLDVAQTQPLALPPVATPGATWAQPIAPLCAELSRLATDYNLDVEAHGSEGLWFLWLIPGWATARWHCIAGDQAMCLPLPDGVVTVSTASPT